MQEDGKCVYTYLKRTRKVLDVVYNMKVLNLGMLGRK